MIAQSFRYWLADLISGGEFLRLHGRSALCGSLESAFERERRQKNEYRDFFLDAQDDAMRFSEALHTINAMETPKANATVRRMARAAREAVK